MKFGKEIQRGAVVGTYVSAHPDRAYIGDDYFVTKPVTDLAFDLEGAIGDRHHGLSTVSGGRFSTLYARDTTVRNNRQWSAISPEEIQNIAAGLEVSELTPQLLGINLLVEGLGSVSQLPPMTYLIFSPEQGDFRPQRPDDVTLIVYGEALPCRIAGKALVEPYQRQDLESAFPKAAMGKRGTTGWVEKGGIVQPGHAVYALTPTGKD
ncbi:MAG TPA: molybdenum cofactor sulfurase [Candidatus Nanoarchaeia archaeon]|nr:molybdenum cofactor sulfurase [Candidatus Nanoarchaeia archaeon]